MAAPQPPRRPVARPRRRRTVWTVVLVLVAVCVLLVAVGAVLAAPTVREVVADQSVRTTLPATAGGLTKGDDAGVLAELEDIDLASFDTKVKGYYEDGKRPIVVWGGTSLLLMLDFQLDQFFHTVADGGDDVRQRTEVPAGSVGGQLECAAMVTDDGTNGLCVWLNHGALLAFLSPDRLPPAKAGAQVVEMLPDLLHRS